MRLAAEREFLTTSWMIKSSMLFLVASVLAEASRKRKSQRVLAFSF
jgi:hypothetical protein